MTNEQYPMLDLFERTLDLVCIVDKAGWFKKVNPAVVRTLGYSEEELFSRPVSELIHPDDRKITASRRKNLLNNIPLLNFQNRYISKTGAVIWLEWTSIYIPEKEIVFAIAKEISKRKEVEIEIEQNYEKYRRLAAHFKHHVEKDRQFFAMELHEELAQLAAVVKMDLEWITTQEHLLDETTKKRLEHGLSTSQLLIDKIRKLSYSVSAADIKEFGLDVVLHSLCREFSSITGIPCLYTSTFKETDLGYEAKLDLLRICQEALLNVMQHAEATEVTITLQAEDSTVELLISDNGKGFDQESQENFGLQNMHGRVASINGILSIESKKRKGTKISVRVGTDNHHEKS